MSGSARQSYYEIALTSRQVMTVFVVLLLAVLAAFVSGVWVGRKGPAPTVETVEAQAIEGVDESDDAPIERLDFFKRNGAPGAAAADEAAPAGAEPMIETPPAKAAAEESPRVARTEPPAAVPPPVVKKPIADQPAAAKPAPPAAEPTPAAPETQVAEAPAARASAGSLVVQVFSSNNQVQAQTVVDELRAGGYPALLSPVEVSGRTMYRVRIGPYGDRKVAEGIAEQVRSKFRLETWITE